MIPPHSFGFLILISLIPTSLPIALEAGGNVPSIKLLVEKSCNPKIAHSFKQCKIGRHRLYIVQNGNVDAGERVKKIWKVDDNRAVLEYNQDLYLLDKNAIQKCDINKSRIVSQKLVHRLRISRIGRRKNKKNKLELKKKGEPKKIGEKFIKNEIEVKRSSSEESETFTSFTSTDGSEKSKTSDSDSDVEKIENKRGKKGSNFENSKKLKKRKGKKKSAGGNGNVCRWIFHKFKSCMGLLNPRKYLISAIKTCAKETDEAEIVLIKGTQNQAEFKSAAEKPPSFGKTTKNEKIEKQQEEGGLNFAWMAQKAAGRKSNANQIEGHDDDEKQALLAKDSFNDDGPGSSFRLKMVELPGGNGGAWLQIGLTKIKTIKVNEYGEEVSQGDREKCVAQVKMEKFNDDSQTKSQGQVFRLGDGMLYFYLDEILWDISHKFGVQYKGDGTLFKVSLDGIDARDLHKVCREELLKIPKIDQISESEKYVDNMKMEEGKATLTGVNVE